MNVNTAIGEVGIKVDEREYILRPSFLAMSKIGNPEQIVLQFKVICSAFEFKMGVENPLFPYLKTYPLCLFDSFYKIIKSCLVSGDAFDICGTIHNGKHVQRAIPYGDMVTLAFHLMKWGIYGSPSERVIKSNRRGKELTEFNPMQAVGLAVAQFGLSTNDAWSLTMPEYQSAWEGKYPEDESRKQPISDEDAKKAMDWSAEFNSRPEVKKALDLAIAKKYGVQNG